MKEKKKINSLFPFEHQKNPLKPALSFSHEMPFSKPHNTQRCQMNSTVSLINWLAERNPTICSKLPWR